MANHRRTTEEIERGLMAVALHNGNTRAASDLLAQDGLVIPFKTLHDWIRKTHLERYEAIRAEMLPQIRSHAAALNMQLAERAIDVEGKIVERLGNEVDSLDPRDLAGAARNMSVVKGVATEKALLLDGEPTQRVAIDFDGTVKELKALGVEVIDVEAVEVEPPELEAATASPPEGSQSP